MLFRRTHCLLTVGLGALFIAPIAIYATIRSPSYSFIDIFWGTPINSTGENNHPQRRLGKYYIDYRPIILKLYFRRFSASQFVAVHRRDRIPVPTITFKYTLSITAILLLK